MFSLLSILWVCLIELVSAREAYGLFAGAKLRQSERRAKLFRIFLIVFSCLVLSSPPFKAENEAIDKSKCQKWQQIPQQQTEETAPVAIEFRMSQR